MLRLQRPKKTSRTSSKPPSMDRKERRAHAKPGGAKPGHEGHSRVASGDPDTVVDHRPDRCACCGDALHGDLPAEVVSVFERIELPEVAPIMTQHRRLAVCCPSCEARVIAPVPEAARGTPFGPRLHAVAIYLKTFQALSYERLQATLSDLFGLAGPFTVESLSPHRIIPSDSLDLDEELDALDGRRERTKAGTPTQDFSAMVLENLSAAGMQGRDRADRVRFTMLQPWPGRFIGAEGRFVEGGTADEPGLERRAAILIGPEFGTLSRPDLVAAAREAADARFDVLVACAFAYDAHASELTRLGPLPILQAKMNPDLHMADDLKTTGKGNLFVVFGEPDIDIRRLDGDRMEVEVKGIDVFDPNTGEVRSDDTSGIAAWFIDTDYDEESFFVRHAYFLGANDPYKSLKTALKAEIDEAAWATLYRATSRPFTRPATGRIAVKVINHFGDEVMKVYGV